MHHTVIGGRALTFGCAHATRTGSALNGGQIYEGSGYIRVTGCSGNADSLNGGHIFEEHVLCR